MIYPTSGISILAHVIVIATTKARNFLGFETRNNNNAVPRKNSLINKIFVSLSVAIIIESISVLVIGSSIAALDAGLFSKNSNYNIIKNAYSSLIHNQSVNLSYIKINK